MTNTGDDDILGKYHWELKEVTESDTFANSFIGQYGKFRMAVESIIKPSYDNGVFSIMETDKI